MGYFLIQIILVVIGIIKAKSGGWFFYGIGAVLQLFSILGMQRKFSYWGMDSTTSGVWGIYAAILLVGAIIIAVRRNAD